MQVWKRALVGLAALVATACSGGAPAPATGDMVMGQANAPVTIIEYASPTCPVHAMCAATRTIGRAR